MSIDTNSRRAWVLGIVFGLMGLVLIARLFTMQVLDKKYGVMAHDQAVIRKVIYPARGIIVDRNGQSLLTNKISVDIGVTPSKITEIDTLQFCSYLDIDQSEFEERIKTAIIRQGALRMSVFQTFLTEEQHAKFQENIFDFPGFELIERTTREYPRKIGAGFLGYINQISRGMLETERYSSYRQGDFVGITGLESVYEEVLRGQRGVEYLVRDVMNRPQDSYMNGALDTMALAGKNLELHLDADLQAYGEELFEGKIGSVIAIDPKTGGILAMVSAPTFDPNLLSGGDLGRNFSKLYQLPTRPLFNRAVQAQYPPGSTFKPVTALVGLDVGAITPSFGLGCSGGYFGCGKRIGCTNTRGGHAANLKTAIATSCNSYFLHTFRLIVDSKNWAGGKREGIQKWHDYLYDFGLGHALGVDITGEYKGSIPDAAYFDRIYNDSWNSCNMVGMGMGQGEIDMTPMQMANVMAIIANKGYYYKPHLVRSVDGDPKSEVLEKYLVRHRVGDIKEATFQHVIDGMEEVVKNGTGRIAQIPDIRVAGKTGTVENYDMLDGKRTKLDNHSVFVCFAPVDDPQIAIAVVVQNAGYGSTWAAPIATLMMEKYLTGTVKRTALEERMKNSNTIKKYIYTLDSIQRLKDMKREELRNLDMNTKLMLQKQQDTMMVKYILREYYGLKTEEQ